jgi:hypothetical protein
VEEYLHELLILVIYGRGQLRIQTDLPHRNAFIVGGWTPKTGHVAVEKRKLSVMASN